MAPVAAEIARTLMPAASSGATLARLVSWALRASDAVNRVVSAFMAYFTASDKRVAGPPTRDDERARVPVAAEIARTLMPAASSGATLARLALGRCVLRML